MLSRKEKEKLVRMWPEYALPLATLSSRQVLHCMLLTMAAE
jgi:hypothetical protein